VKGVAKAYADLLDLLIVDLEDQSLQSDIEKLGVKPVSANIRMNSLADKQRLARQVLALFSK
ncbi:MAG TPA: 2-phospho-L-lactate transferase, partial [Candidatus Binatia bacterium]|nr:2-phospho-L-lactate transferase [Candidatus Binatia bacterium]